MGRALVDAGLRTSHTQDYKGGFMAATGSTPGTDLDRDGFYERLRGRGREELGQLLGFVQEYLAPLLPNRPQISAGSVAPKSGLVTRSAYRERDFELQP